MPIIDIHKYVQSHNYLKNAHVKLIEISEKNNRSCIDNVLRFTFDGRSIHSNTKTNSEHKVVSAQRKFGTSYVRKTRTTAHAGITYY